MSFEESLRAYREQIGLTQQQVASKMGITKSTYCGYETGKRQPDVKKLKQISNILGVSVDDLLDTGFQSKIPDTSTPMTHIYNNEFLLISGLLAQLNAEGCEKVVDYAKDLVAGGRYKKINQHSMGKEA